MNNFALVTSTSNQLYMPNCSLLLVNLQDHGILRDGSKETIDSENDFARRTLAQDVNRHAAVVLEGRALGETNYSYDLNIIVLISCCAIWLTNSSNPNMDRQLDQNRQKPIQFWLRNWAMLLIFGGMQVSEKKLGIELILEELRQNDENWRSQLFSPNWAFYRCKHWEKKKKIKSARIQIPHNCVCRKKRNRPFLRRKKELVPWSWGTVKSERRWGMEHPCTEFVY